MRHPHLLGVAMKNKQEENQICNVLLDHQTKIKLIVCLILALLPTTNVVYGQAKSVEAGSSEAFRIQYRVPVPTATFVEIKHGAVEKLPHVKVIQVVDEHAAIIAVRKSLLVKGQYRSSTWFDGEFYFVGPTAGWIDGRSYETKLIAAVDGTKTYTTVAGGTKTIQRLRIATDEEKARADTAIEIREAKIAAKVLESDRNKEKIMALLPDRKFTVRLSNGKIALRSANLNCFWGAGNDADMIGFTTKKKAIHVRLSDLHKTTAKAIASTRKAILIAQLETGERNTFSSEYSGFKNEVIDGVRITSRAIMK